jgi:hypothetical protein
MSKITLAPNAAGTGTLTIAAPNTSTDYTLTLPTATTTLVGTDATQTLTNKSIAGSQLTGTVAGSLLTGTVASSLLTGALPAISGAALTGINTTPTTAQVGTATAGLAADAVGSYAWLMRTSGSTAAFTFGTTYAGSGLGASGFCTPGTNADQALSSVQIGATVSGTWRAMGNASNANSNVKHTLFLRIS